VRYTQQPQDLYAWFEPYLDDPEEIDVRAGGGGVVTIGAMLRQWLTRLEWYDTLFPRIPVQIQSEIMARLKSAYGDAVEAPGAVAGAKKMTLQYVDDDLHRSSRSRSRSLSKARKSRSRSKSDDEKSRSRHHKKHHRKGSRHRSRTRSKSRSRSRSRSYDRHKDRDRKKHKSHKHHHKQRDASDERRRSKSRSRSKASHEKKKRRDSS
jgi:pre-mRNA-splicing factor 38B